ncbi:MAG: hypothetical protein HOO97_07060 [Sideroxydans sp.]|nr:hypothetical protein [Sideroxydans sp.]
MAITLQVLNRKNGLIAAMWCIFFQNINYANATDFVLKVGKGELAYQMQERGATGALLNSEEGSLPVLRMNATATREDWMLEAACWRSEGLIPYVGMTQIGFPVLTFTQLKILNAQLALSKVVIRNEHFTYALIGGFGHTQVSRNIFPSANSLPLHETLDITQARIGSTVQLPILNVAQSPLIFSIEATALPAVRNRLEVNTFGLYDPITLKPGLKIDWSVKATLDFQPSSVLNVWAYAERQSLTPSSTPYQIWTQGGVAVTAVRYPGSKQFMNHVVMGIGVQF